MVWCCAAFVRRFGHHCRVVVERSLSSSRLVMVFVFMTSSCVVGHREGEEQQERKKEKERQKYEEIGNDAKIAEKTASNGANPASQGHSTRRSQRQTQGQILNLPSILTIPKIYVCGTNFPNPNPNWAPRELIWITSRSALKSSSSSA